MATDLAIVAWLQRIKSVNAQLETEGILVGTELTTDLFGARRGQATMTRGSLHALVVALSANLDALVGWKGLTGFASSLGTTGRGVSEQVGDTQGLSNIDAPAGWRLYELWLEQRFAKERIAARLGLYDLNSEFYVSETAGLFLNGAQGIGPELSAMDDTRPSTFPSTALGFRLHLQATQTLYAQAALLDAAPATVGGLGHNRLRVGADEGALTVVEAGFTQPSATGERKAAAGAWHYTNASEVGPAGGYYGLVDLGVYREDAYTDEGLNVFARYGYGRVGAVVRSWGGGIVYTGLMPGRSADRLGVALAAACPRHRGGEYPLAACELVMEVTYQAELMPGVSIQPNMQYVQHPGMSTSASSVLAVGLRSELSL